MAKRKVEVCDNVKDLEHKKFRVDEDDKNIVYVSTYDDCNNMVLEDILEKLSNNPMSNIKWDFFTTDYPDTITEVFTYYYGTGDATGDQAGVVTVTYTDSTKCEILSVGVV